MNWESPYTLDISGVENDIEYLIDIRQHKSTSITQENAINTNYTAILPDSDSENLICKQFEIVVTPYNDGGYGNSTSIVTYPNQGSKFNRNEYVQMK